MRVGRRCGVRQSGGYLFTAVLSLNFELVRAMSEEAPSTTYVVWWAIMICMAVLLCYRCWQSTQDAEADMHAMRHRHDLLIDVRDTFVEQGEAEWECPVCGFLNLPRRQACVLCTTQQHSVLAISKLTRQAEMSGYYFDEGRSFDEGSIGGGGGLHSRPGSRFANLSSYNTPPLTNARVGHGLESFAEEDEDSWAQSGSLGGSAAERGSVSSAAAAGGGVGGAGRGEQRTHEGDCMGGVAGAAGSHSSSSSSFGRGGGDWTNAQRDALDIFTPTTRERSFRVRHLNALSMRQKGAARRKQWVRTQGHDGLVRWERAKDAREEARKQQMLLRARLRGGGEAGGLVATSAGAGASAGGWPWGRKPRQGGGDLRGMARSHGVPPAGAYTALDDDDGPAAAGQRNPMGGRSALTGGAAAGHRRVASVGVGETLSGAAQQQQHARGTSSSLLAQNAEIIAARNAVRASEGYAPPPLGSATDLAQQQQPHKRAISGPLTLAPPNGYFGQAASLRSNLNVGRLSTEVRLTFVCVPDSDNYALDRAAGQARRAARQQTGAELLGAAEHEAAAAAALRAEEEAEEVRAAEEAHSRTVPGGKQLSPLKGNQLGARRPDSYAMPADSLQFKVCVR